MIKSTGCSPKGPGFKSQHHMTPHTVCNSSSRELDGVAVCRQLNILGKAAQGRSEGHGINSFVVCTIVYTADLEKRDGNRLERRMRKTMFYCRKESS